jgi:lipopolysaccharide-induced tumor necrosis factor-alpha factor
MENPPPFMTQPQANYAPTQPVLIAEQPAVNVYQARPAPVVVIRNAIGPYPQQVKCSQCGIDVITETHETPGLLTYLLSGGLCLIGCWFGCCLIPFCITECQDIIHQCPNCKKYLGTSCRL